MTTRGRGTMLRLLLNRARWDRESSQDDLVLTVTEREDGRVGAREVPLSEVAEVLATGVLTGDGTFFPYHRIISVRSAVSVVWQAREGRHRDET